MLNTENISLYKHGHENLLIIHSSSVNCALELLKRLGFEKTNGTDNSLRQIEFLLEILQHLYREKTLEKTQTISFLLKAILYMLKLIKLRLTPSKYSKQ